MKIIEPKIELTEKEVDAINTVISLCSDLRDINSNFLDFIFGEDDADKDFQDTIDTLNDILYNCED